MGTLERRREDQANNFLAKLVGEAPELSVGYGRSSGTVSKKYGSPRDVQNSGEDPELYFRKPNPGAEKVVRKTMQCPKDGTCVRKVDCKESRIGATVAMPVQ